jgi:hypothetical protein
MTNIRKIMIPGYMWVFLYYSGIHTV